MDDKTKESDDGKVKGILKSGGKKTDEERFERPHMLNRHHCKAYSLVLLMLQEILQSNDCRNRRP